MSFRRPAWDPRANAAAFDHDDGRRGKHGADSDRVVLNPVGSPAISRSRPRHRRQDGEASLRSRSSLSVRRSTDRLGTAVEEASERMVTPARRDRYLGSSSRTSSGSFGASSSSE